LRLARPSPDQQRRAPGPAFFAAVARLHCLDIARIFRLLSRHGRS
jgi:hypothetical protein